MIDRNLDKFIENHYNGSRSALLLTGARQVGKTLAIRKYAQKARLNLLEINFYEDKEARRIFEGARNVQEVLFRMSAYYHQTLEKGKTLVFFDEVQVYADVVTWVKFLVEEGSFLYALSGSLLGVTLKDIRSIPVGYMDVKEVFPLDLREFAQALGVGNQVMESLEKSWKECIPVDEVVHESMLRIVTLYLLIGGMPAVVQTYLDTNDLQAVRKKQNEILQLYRWDIAQYDPNNKLYIDEIFSLMPSELNAKNKRFILKNMNEHRQYSRMENGFIWLKDAGVALPTYNVSEPKAPLKLSESRSLFKLFQNDVGLLAAQYAEGIALQMLSGDTLINYGAVYENLVAQEFRAHGWQLYYYNNKKQGELDFLLEQDNRIIPIEVKSGKDYQRHVALSNVLASPDYSIRHAVVLCNGNMKRQEQIVYAPVYMTMFMQKQPSETPLIYKPDMTGLTA